MQHRTAMKRPSTKGARRANSQGFTLIEVMLVAMIMGMMMVSISKLMQAARRTRDTIHNFQETQLAGPAVLEMITRDLQGLITTGRPRTDWLRVSDRTVNGLDADRIDFITTTDSLFVEIDDDDKPLRADINEVGYVLRPNPDNDEFLEIYRREGFSVDDEPMEGGQYTFLSDQVKGLNIEVFHTDGPDAEPEDEWLAESVAPPPGVAAATGLSGTTNIDADAEGIGGLPAWIKISLTIELKPRIDRESMDFSGNNKRTITYVRNHRFPDVQRVAMGDIPRLGIPPAPSAGGDPANPGSLGNGQDPQGLNGQGQGPDGEITLTGGGGGGARPGTTSGGRIDAAKDQ